MHNPRVAGGISDAFQLQCYLLRLGAKVDRNIPPSETVVKFAPYLCRGLQQYLSQLVPSITSPTDGIIVIAKRWQSLICLVLREKVNENAAFLAR